MTPVPEARSRSPVRPLAAEVNALAERLAEFAESQKSEIDAVDPAHRGDAENLVRYLALRNQDVRELQRRLAEQGLSSLGRCEPHVSATIRAVQRALGEPTPTSDASDNGADFAKGRMALDVNTDALFGPRPEHRVPRIMVTLPTEAAEDLPLVLDFVRRGMDVARINGAHDDPPAWEAMAKNVRAASASVGRHVAISFDLPGAKLRTGPIADGPPVRRLHPVRDSRGVAVIPARVTLAAAVSEGEPGVIPVAADWLRRLHPGDTVTLNDTRGSARTLTVTSTDGTKAAAELWDTTYLETGTTLRRDADSTTVGPLPAVEQHHLLRVGDTLRMVRDDEPSPPWRPGMPGEARIGCSLPAAFDAVRRGDRVVLDDGKLHGIVEGVGDGDFVVRITDASPKGTRLRASKGINLPDSHLVAPILSDADEPLLQLAASYGDLLALSFVCDESDVDAALARVGDRHAENLGLILKIETIPGFQHLPAILLRAMRHPRVGVMIARGDLAVETSYERLAEIQEEILWLCEAAHLPVIWATQVLDQLARTGQPSRAEVTDAAMSQRAECVMLNKGPYVGVAISTLDDILRRMAGHQRKKTALLRPLHSWQS